MNNIQLQSEFVTDLFPKESKMDSLIIKQEPNCEEDIGDFFCEEEIKVCSEDLSVIVVVVVVSYGHHNWV